MMNKKYVKTLYYVIGLVIAFLEPSFLGEIVLGIVGFIDIVNQMAQIKKNKRKKEQKEYLESLLTD